MNAPTNTTQLEEATVSERRGVSNAEYRVVGTLESVLKVIESIFINYDVRGYGTHVHAIGMETDGRYYARISRMLSCD